MLKPGGKLLILYMGWLPYEDPIAGKSEEIIFIPEGQHKDIGYETPDGEGLLG